MKLPFRLPFSIPKPGFSLSDVFSLGRRELVIILTVSASVLVAALIVAVLLTLPSGNRESAPAQASETARPASDRAFLSDYIIYDDVLEKRLTEPVRFREPPETWGPEQVRLFWTEPSEIGADVLEIEAEKTVRSIFADVR